LFHQPGDLKCITKKGDLWARWEETKERSEHDHTCLAPGDVIATMGSKPIPAGRKAPPKHRRNPINNSSSKAKRGQPKDDDVYANPSVALPAKTVNHK
jgi:hypothetical protein